MANRFSLGYPQAANLAQPRGKYRRAVIRSATDTINLTTSEVVNDKIYFARVPSNAIIKPTSQIIHGAFGGTAALSWGVLDETPAGAFNCLGAAQSAVAAQTRLGLISVPVANLSRLLWQLAGFTADPGRELILGATVVTGPIAAAGALFFDFHWNEDT